MVTIEVTVRVRGPVGLAAPLTLSETLEVSTDSFGELADVLEQFHVVADDIRNSQAGLQRPRT